MTDQAAPPPEPRFDRAQTGWLTRDGKRLETLDAVYAHLDNGQAERATTNQ